MCLYAASGLLYIIYERFFCLLIDVVNFDHHCKWLNTCVGSKNYATFLMLVASITTLITVSFSCSIVHMVNIFTAADNSDFHHRGTPINDDCCILFSCASQNL